MSDSASMPAADRPTRVARLWAEYRGGPLLGLGTPAPRLSWTIDTGAAAWRQEAYELEIDGAPLSRVDSNRSVFVPWPAAPLRSRQQVTVRVRVWGSDGQVTAWSDPLTFEAGLLDPADWTARWITKKGAPALDRSEPAPYFRRAFQLQAPPSARLAKARLWSTAAGVYELHLNGAVVGDEVLAPGWSAYPHRLLYATHDVTAMLHEGDNLLGAVVADGWWRGNLGWEMQRNVYGDRLGLLAQLEVVWSDGSTSVVATDRSWSSATGPILQADLYNGETFDAGREEPAWSMPGRNAGGWAAVTEFEPDVGDLVPPQGPPIRRTGELAVQEVLRTPSGRSVLDFGQNLVGRVRFTVEGPAGATVTLRHAEVLEAGELGTRPLRNAKATDRYILRGGGPETWEPRFTFHGFRYVEVEGWPGNTVDPDAFTAVVLHSDLERTGTFHCSNDLLNRLHENAVWGMRGNFVGVPTDCPQRDERLGWTGDLQVFGPTAAFLYDVGGFLADWLADLAVEQAPDGTVPVVIPHVAVPVFPAAAWSDAATVVPWTLYESYDDIDLLARQLSSMRAWVDRVSEMAGERRLWLMGFQFGDWLDPDAPPEQPAKAKTAGHLVASAYFARSAQIVADAAAAVGEVELAETYRRLAAEIRAAFNAEYVTPNGRLSSDAATAYALALVFELLEKPAHRVRAGRLLRHLVRANGYRVSTGFVGTPLVLPALSSCGDEVTAYRLLTETGCPSWLYPVTMGATTIWERWDSMLPDGSINPGGMTSFNHYALGSVAAWMHETIGGLAAAEPGYRKLRVAPVPGRGVTSGEAALRTPYGTARCAWETSGREVHLEVDVPPNTSATVIRPGLAADLTEPLDVLAGHHHWTYSVDAETAARWIDSDDVDTMPR